MPKPDDLYDRRKYVRTLALIQTIRDYLELDGPKTVKLLQNGVATEILSRAHIAWFNLSPEDLSKEVLEEIQTDDESKVVPRGIQ